MTLAGSTAVGVGVVGLGYWGPNLARNFDRLPEADLRWICDASEERRARAAAGLPGARPTPELDEVLADPEVDAVVLATHVPTHAELAVRVLEAGRHCFVEKPLAQSTTEAERVVEAAERRGPRAHGGAPARVPPRRGEAARAGGGRWAR